MIKTDDRTPRFTARGLAVGGGLVLAGLSLGGMLAATQAVNAAPVNYVRSVNHDAVSNVALDEEVVIRFNAAVAKATVGPDTILIRTGATNGEQARGQYVVGKFMFDKSTQRRVVIRPEAVQEYFQLNRSLPRTDAKRKARNLIRRVEKTGKFRMFRKVDKGLRGFFGEASGVSVRLDDDGDGGAGNGTSAFYPPPVDSTNPIEQYRFLIAGDDALWAAHIDTTNLGRDAAYLALTSQSEWERFWHETDLATGIRSDKSVLREREYRQVLINRRPKARVMFVPDIPIRADLSDTGFDAARAYSVNIPTGQPGVFNTVQSRNGRRPIVQEQGRDFSTLFTTVPTTAGDLFLDNESRKGVGVNQKPRVINMTPPEGEFNIDPTTDWEDPDNLVNSNEASRRTFTVRLRFNQPLDPRTVNASSFQLEKTGTVSSDAEPGDPPTPLEPVLPVAIGTFLNQHRLGIVEVEVTPANNLDPQGVYRLRVQPQVAGLSREQLGQPFTAEFIVGKGAPPVDRVKINFDTATDVANPASPNHPDQITTALWPAPDLFDPERTGKAVAAFLPAVGLGQGAPPDPSQDPGQVDPEQFEKDLIRSSGDTVVFLTESTDPSSPNFGQQIEYEYASVLLEFTTVRAIGRYPLVIRSQSGITMIGSFVFLNGEDGGDGLTNIDPTTGGPTGGLGGAPGPGGRRGGDGGNAPATDGNHNPILDSQGNFLIDAGNTAGEDGVPGFQFAGTGTGSAGSGGFSANQQGTTLFSNGQYLPPASPDRVRESGGGGGHGTAGADGSGARVTGQLHDGNPDYNGGVGGEAFGELDFSDQGLNGPLGQGVPVLGLDSCGRGGGGGGLEKEDDGTGDLETVGAEDPGGGGGGGGGGGLHLVARDEIVVSSTEIHVEGGAGGQTLGTEGAANPGAGFGAPGGGGSGGSIWFQSFGIIDIINGTKLLAGGGDTSASIGQNAPAPLANPSSPPPADSLNDTVTGNGGMGGAGIIRLDSRSGVANIDPASLVDGVLTEGVYLPGTESDQGVFQPLVLDSIEGAPLFGYYQSHPTTPFVVGNGTGYSRWYNSQIDTPNYRPVYDDPATPQVDGTLLVQAPSGSVQVLARGAFNDVGNNGNPDLNSPTGWFDLEDVNEQVRDRRFLQIRVEFRVQEGYTFGEDRPYADCVQIDIELK